jgi:hypothetical protein
VTATKTRRDLGVDKLKRDLAELKATKITTGWQGQSGQTMHRDSDATNERIAAYHEFGTKHMPARPAIRTTYDRHSAEFTRELKRAVSDLVDGRSELDPALDRVGEFAVSKLREEMNNSKTWAAPLAQSTIDLKGHDTPLIDTRQLENAASYAIRDAGPEGSVGIAIKRQGGER